MKIYIRGMDCVNKGYGAAKHIAALKEIGPCVIHRKTFIKNFVSEA